MLKKLLKYDLRSIFKYWWIAAVSSLALSIAGGGCMSVMNSERELPTVLYMTALMVFFLVMFSYVAFAILSPILIFIRFYKNFFSDEGYLTFTLPVKRSQLLNSKLIMSSVTMIATGVMLIINVVVMLVIAFAEEIFTKEFFEDCIKFFEMLFEKAGIYVIVYLAEALIIMTLSVIFSNLFLYCCITFASIITRKAKVITAIGIYYGANAVFSFVLQMFYLFGITSLISRFSVLPESSILPMEALVLLGIILFFAVACAMLYTLQYWMIDRKLNLS